MPRKKKNAWIFIVIIAVIAVGVSIYAIFFANKDEGIKVTTEKASLRTITQTVSAIGVIEPETEVKVSSETSGEIIFLGAEEGDAVEKGKLLVRIKPDIVETQLEQFQASADAAKMDVEVRKAEMKRSENDLKRITELFEKDFVSKQEFDRAKAAYESAASSYQASISRYDQALASLKQIKRSAERTVIYSPIDGVITSLSVEKGENVVGTATMQGTEMMRVADLNIMNAVVDVDENDIVLIELGDTTEVEIDAFEDRKFLGEVVEIGHSAKQTQLGTQDQVVNFEVKIRLLELDPKLRPGMSCNAEIKTETRADVVSVPLQAVTIRPEKDFDRKPDVNEGSRIKKKEESKIEKKRPPSVIFVLDGEIVRKRKVKTGISDAGYIEITEGIEEGETVVSGSFQAISKELSDSSKVKIDSVKKFNFSRKNK